MTGYSNPVRVLHVTFDMGIGGTEQVIRELVTHLPASEFTHRVVCIDGRVGPIGEQLQQQGIDVEALKRASGFDRYMIASIKARIREYRIDIVHCHQYTPWVYGLLAALGTGARVVFTEHGRFYPDRYRYKALLINPVMALLTNAIVAISSATRDALGRYEFIPKRKVQIVYNGIEGWSADLEQAARVRRELGIPSEDPVLGTIARLDPVKNQTMMLEAFAGVLNTHPNAWLLMVGDGPDRDRLEALAEQLDITGRVKFVGFKNQPIAYLSAMNGFLLSSHTEGTSMTLLEAMSLGIPTVATRVGGNPEIIDNERTGLLTPAGDAAAFQAAIVRLLDDPILAQSLSEAAIQRFKRDFSVQSMQASYAGLYRRILKRSAAAATI